MCQLEDILYFDTVKAQNNFANCEPIEQCSFGKTAKNVFDNEQNDA